ncbi:MAG: trypsin-like peptidase domain-containing protein [Acidimicrobiia bacterium]|nr:trypsin-like peptidase domain-containing protein [Acidimicrobiia bacterium]
MRGLLSTGWRRPMLVVVAVILFVLAVTTTSTMPARFDVTPIAKSDVDTRLEASTASLISLGCDLSLDSGTGVAVSGDVVITNRHVADRFRTLNLVYDATPSRQLAPGLVGIDQGNDVAVLRTGHLGLTPLALANTDPRPGEAVWISGYAHELGPDSLADGLVVAPAHVVRYESGADSGQQRRVMRVDVPVRPGMSGGAVLDQSGRLGGIVFAVDGPTNQGLVIPASTIRQVLGQQLPSAAGC